MVLPRRKKEEFFEKKLVPIFENSKGAIFILTILTLLIGLYSIVGTF